MAVGPGTGVAREPTLSEKIDLLGPYGEPWTRNAPEVRNMDSLPRWEGRKYEDTAYLAGVGEILRGGAYEQADSGAAISLTAPVYGGAAKMGTITLTTYAVRNSNSLSGWDVRVTLPDPTGDEPEIIEDIGVVNYVPGDPVPEDFARELLRRAPHLVDQALDEDRRGWFRKLIDAIF